VSDRAVARASPSPARLGRYELIASLAKGGMGEVHLARTRGVGGFERLVVVKHALPSLADRTQQMLLAEARLAATLQHTNIVQVHDVDTDDGIVFLAMEYLHGQDVRAVLRRSWGRAQPLGVAQALAIVLPVCAGLHYAHDKRDSDGQPLEIVHRDVSPSNVFVTYDGGVKLIDFGIAKATTLPSETQLGMIKGKPGYMSPEQCRCEPLDRRSDVFCLGIVLYELTLGLRPFRADNAYLLICQILEEDPPRPTAVDPAYPAELEAIVMRALAKDRRDRYPSALAMQEALVALVGQLRLDVSQFALGRAMASLFEAELAVWHAAQRAGQSLVDHVIKRTTSMVAIVDPPPRSSGQLPGQSIEISITSDHAPASDVATAARPPHHRRGAIVAVAVAAVGAATIAAAIAILSTRPDPANAAASPGSPVATHVTASPPTPPPQAPPAPVTAPPSTTTDPPAPQPAPVTAPPASVAAYAAHGTQLKAPVKRPAKRPKRFAEPPKPRGPDELIE
jgi:serine/threonine protein kinase